MIIRWVDGKTTEEPMRTVFEDCPAEVIDYGRRNSLLGQQGWSKVNTIATSQDARMQVVGFDIAEEAHLFGRHPKGPSAETSRRRKSHEGSILSNERPLRKGKRVRFVGI